jgi:hypothetical protein
MKSVKHTIPAVAFSMTNFVWNSDAAVFVFKDGKLNVDRMNLFPGKPMKVVLIGDEPNEAQLQAIKEIWRALRDQYGADAALFCPAIEKVWLESQLGLMIGA